MRSIRTHSSEPSHTETSVSQTQFSAPRSQLMLKQRSEAQQRETVLFVFRVRDHVYHFSSYVFSDLIQFYLDQIVLVKV